MTVQEMHTMVAVKLQKLNSYAYDDFSPEEIDLILNDAQLRFIKNRMSKESDPKRIGYEGNQKRLNDIRTLLTVFEHAFDPLPGAGEAKDVTLPENFFLEDSSSVRTRFSLDTAAPDSMLRVIPVRIVETHRFEEDMQNPFRKTLATSLPGKIEGDKLHIECDKRFILVSLRLNYVRIPRKIRLSSDENSVDCELPKHTHPEIVDLAVSQILELIESQRYQSSKIDAAGSE